MPRPWDEIKLSGLSNWLLFELNVSIYKLNMYLKNPYQYLTIAATIVYATTCSIIANDFCLKSLLSLRSRV